MRYFFKLFSNSFIIFFKSKLKPLLVLGLVQVLFFNVVTWKWGKVFNFFLTIGYNCSFFLLPGFSPGVSINYFTKYFGIISHVISRMALPV
jgi:hypothetical protein